MIEYRVVSRGSYPCIEGRKGIKLEDSPLYSIKL